MNRPVHPGRRFERAGSALALIAALISGTPALATTQRQDVIWLDLCDATHSGRRIALPLQRERDRPPPLGCHAACALLPERRTVRR